MLRIYLISFIRFFYISLIFKKPFLFYFFRLLSKTYIFRYIVKRDIDSAINLKGYHKKNQIPTGHIIQNKKVFFFILKLKIFSFVIEEGKNLTIEHYYLNRSLKDIKLLMKLTLKYINISKNSTILDPGCGPGRHLIYLTDLFKCKGIGIDIYKPAINVANKIKITSNCNFIHGSSLDINLTKRLDKKSIDFVLINSWLGFVKKRDDFIHFLEFISSLKCKILIITNKEDSIRDIFIDYEVKFEHIDNKTKYALLEKLNKKTKQNDLF